MNITKQEIKTQISEIISSNPNPIISDEIYRLLQGRVEPGRTQETIRKYIREMVNSGDYLIGSSNKGYFKIRTLQQVQNAIDYLESRIPDLQNRANTIRQKWNENHPDNQID